MCRIGDVDRKEAVDRSASGRSRGEGVVCLSLSPKV